jgi:hypothetical protein
MLIRVIYQDFRYDYVKSWVLDDLIESGKVAMFRRKNGWAIVGIDPIRRKKHHFGEFTDRRSGSVYDS